MYIIPIDNLLWLSATTLTYTYSENEHEAKHAAVEEILDNSNVGHSALLIEQLSYIFFNSLRPDG